MIAPKSSYKQGDFIDDSNPPIFIDDEEDEAGDSLISADADDTGTVLAGDRALLSTESQRPDPFIGAMHGKTVRQQLSSNYFWCVWFVCGASHLGVVINYLLKAYRILPLRIHVRFLNLVPL